MSKFPYVVLRDSCAEPVEAHESRNTTTQWLKVSLDALKKQTMHNLYVIIQQPLPR